LCNSPDDRRAVQVSTNAFYPGFFHRKVAVGIDNDLKKERRLINISLKKNLFAAEGPLCIAINDIHQYNRIWASIILLIEGGTLIVVQLC